MQIVVGTYEGTMYGWEFNPNKMKLELIFAFMAHASCIKSVAFLEGTDTLLSGSSDEMIKLYNVKKRVEIGSLMQHHGDVTCLSTFSKTHVLSGSADHTICIWRASDWNCVHILGGHKNTVNSIAMHPSGKLALSVSKDKTMRMWNLMKGRSAYIRKLEHEASVVFLDQDGDRYGLVMDREVMIVESSSGQKLSMLQHDGRIHTAVFVSKDIVATAGETKCITFWHVDGTKINAFAHKEVAGRVRSMELLSQDDKVYLVTACTTGAIAVWDTTCIDTDTKAEAALVVSTIVRSGSRITCLTTNNHVATVNKAEPDTEPISNSQLAGQKRKAVHFA